MTKEMRNGSISKTTYRDHLIMARATKVMGASRWSVQIDIMCPQGGWLPTICDEDRSFPSEELALSTAEKLAREVVDSR
jgi:hypothetical protein